MAALLSDLKAAIADDIQRGDVTNQIAAAITAAIDFYADTHLYFTETRASTFPTVAAQSRYTSADNTDIPLYLDFERAFIVDGANQLRLEWMKPGEMEYLLGNSKSSGRPHRWSYYGQSVWLYPVPNAVFTFQPLVTVKVPGPATDAEMNNPWMTEAFELIRCRAKIYLSVHTTNDDQLAAKMVLAEKSALTRLRRETEKKAGSGGLQATQF